VDQPLIDRRVDARFPPPPEYAARATLRPGRLVVLVNFSAGGTLLQGAHPFRPGARVHLQVVTMTRTLVLAAHVLRSTVWAWTMWKARRIGGALRFDQRCESFWEAVAAGTERGARRGHR
jgi:hypothetical protein